MKKRALVVGLLLAIVAVVTALLLRAWRLRRAPRTETDVRGDIGAHPADTSAGPVANITTSATAGDDEQPADSGVGDLLHRRYEIVLPGCRMPSAALLHTMQQHMTTLSPATLAEFEKTVGTTRRMEVGDEYEVTMLGPWNGGVRVCEITERSFTLGTLEGHPEAGRITFSVLDAQGAMQGLLVRVESWARSRDFTVRVAYDALGVGKQVQTEVWVTFLQRLSTLAGVTGTLEVQVTTERHEGNSAAAAAVHA